MWEIFADRDIAYDLVRTAEEPNLAEMTAKAIAWYIDEILNLKLREWNKILYLSAQKALGKKEPS